MHQSLEMYDWYAGLENQTRRVVSEAVLTVDTEYGIDSSSNGAIPYHNGAHTRMVCEDLSILRDVLGMTSFEFEVAATAAASHDVVKTFDRAAGVDEEESADWLESQLRSKTNYSRIAVEAARLAIVGTIARFEGGTIVQKSVEQRYPSKRAELIGHAVSGADVGRLFAPEGPLLAHRLFEEQALVSGIKPELVDLLPFQQSQIDFLLSYRYPNRDIELALATHKPQVIRYLGKLSTLLEKGQIGSWQEVLTLDKEFIDTPDRQKSV